MSNIPLIHKPSSHKKISLTKNRKGNILVLAAVFCVAVLGMLAFTVDLGYMVATQGELDRAVDAAALAGAGTLVNGIDEAKLAALDILLLNEVGTQVIPQQEGRESQVQEWLNEHQDDFEVQVGHWYPDTQEFVESDKLPSAVYVKAYYKNPFIFGGALRSVQKDNEEEDQQGNPLEEEPEDFKRLCAEAVARYQPRDIALVLDFSGSMNDDSELNAIRDATSRQAVLANMQQIYEDLGSPQYGNLQFTPVYISSNDNETIKEQLGLVTTTTTEVGGGNGNGRGWGWGWGWGGGGGTTTVTTTEEVEYPYASGSWDDYINYVKSSNYTPARKGYQKKYGFVTLINYWLEKKPSANQTSDLWKVSAQPVTAVKDAVDIFMDYVQEVDCGDKAALVVYNSPSADALLEHSLTQDFDTVQNTVQHRQAAHYGSMTNIGAGIRVGIEELDANARIGAKKMIVLMTDGNANTPYNTSYARQYALDQAAVAASKGYQIVTISLGENADQGLMQEIADITNGTHYNIPGGSSVNDYEDDLLAAFRKIADDRPLLLVK